MEVEHVDFVSFLTQDLARAKRFYGDTLGLELESQGHANMEFRRAR
jgi:catechol 2,3-dioxygenase-like lactoylglutathione lyase family enzyme